MDDSRSVKSPLAGPCLPSNTHDIYQIVIGDVSERIVDFVMIGLLLCVLLLSVWLFGTHQLSKHLLLHPIATTNCFSDAEGAIVKIVIGDSSEQIVDFIMIVLLFYKTILYFIKLLIWRKLYRNPTTNCFNDAEGAIWLKR